jgi:hypothetical protein
MSQTLERVKAGLKRLKVFPLPPVVLLPGSAAPLHVFEPRYRALVKDALDSDSLFALAQVLPGQESLLSGKPELEDVVCVGTITMHEPLDDGRSNLVLVGVARARLRRELPGVHLYREFEAELLEDEALDADADANLRRAVVELIARVPPPVGQRVAQVTSRVRGGPLADVVASTFMQDPSQRYEVLRETDVRARLEIVTEELLTLVGGIKPTKPTGLMN